MNADELFEKCWNENKFGYTNDRKTLAYYAFIEGIQQVKNLNIPAVSNNEAELICPVCNCNKAYWNPMEEYNECPCGHNWVD